MMVFYCCQGVLDLSLVVCLKLEFGLYGKITKNCQLQKKHRETIGTSEFNMGVVVFKVDFGQHRDFISVIIDLWAMRGAQNLRSGTNRHGEEL